MPPSRFLGSDRLQSLPPIATLEDESSVADSLSDEESQFDELDDSEDEDRQMGMQLQLHDHDNRRRGDAMLVDRPLPAAGPSRDVIMQENMPLSMVMPYDANMVQAAFESFHNMPPAYWRDLDKALDDFAAHQATTGRSSGPNLPHGQYMAPVSNQPVVRGTERIAPAHNATNGLRRLGGHGPARVRHDVDFRHVNITPEEAARRTLLYKWNRRRIRRLLDITMREPLSDEQGRRILRSREPWYEVSVMSMYSAVGEAMERIEVEFLRNAGYRRDPTSTRPIVDFDIIRGERSRSDWMPLSGPAGLFHCPFHPQCPVPVYYYAYFITRHLVKFHSSAYPKTHSRSDELMTCGLWAANHVKEDGASGGSVCLEKIKRRDLGNHVARRYTHMFSFIAQCDGCGMVFSGRNSMKNHKQQGKCSMAYDGYENDSDFGESDD